MSDDDIWALRRGGSDPVKVYAAYAAAVKHAGQPTVILAKTVKGYGMGEAGEGQMITHQQKKMGHDALRKFRDRFAIPVTDAKLEEIPFLKLAEGGPEQKYLQERRRQLGGSLPQRRRKSTSLEVPELSAFSAQLASTEQREISTTMAFVRILNTLLRDKTIGKFVVPIVPDESRTFGMEGMFRQLGIFSQVGQLYKPQDADQLMYYREDKSGQMLQEGINEAGAMSSWIAAATSYSTSNVADDPVLHLLLDVRSAARGRSRLGGRRYALPAASCWAAPPDGPPSTAKGCSTRMATAICSPPPFPTASPTIRRLPMRSRSSSKMGCGVCSRIRTTSTTTSR